MVGLFPRMIKKNKDNVLSRVVVVLPYVGNRVLMQLRDHNPNIAFPGRWGFFGGSIESGEKAKETAERELLEEIGYRPKILYGLSVNKIPELSIISYSFFYPLMVSIDELVLNEGLDFGLFTLQEIRSKRLFSVKTNRNFPVIDNPYIEYLVKKLMQKAVK